MSYVDAAFYDELVRTFSDWPEGEIADPATRARLVTDALRWDGNAQPARLRPQSREQALVEGHAPALDAQSFARAIS